MPAEVSLPVCGLQERKDAAVRHCILHVHATVCPILLSEGVLA